MVTRLDAYSVIYGAFLIVLMALSRKQCYYMWLCYITLLVVLLILQYLCCVGIPGFLCFGRSTPPPIPPPAIYITPILWDCLYITTLVYVLLLHPLTPHSLPPLHPTTSTTTPQYDPRYPSLPHHMTNTPPLSQNTHGMVSP